MGTTQFTEHLPGTLAAQRYTTRAAQRLSWHMTNRRTSCSRLSANSLASPAARGWTEAWPVYQKELWTMFGGDMPIFLLQLMSQVFKQAPRKIRTRRVQSASSNLT